MSEDLGPYLGPQALQAIAAMALSMARQIGCIAFIPGFGRNHMTGMHRNAIGLALALPQAAVIWHRMQLSPPSLAHLALLGLKEGLLGALIGLLLASPYWAFRSAFTLVDNQRGANAAQLVNPSMQADSSILGELSERALTVLLIQAGIFGLLFDAIAQTYTVWPALSVLPDLFTEKQIDPAMLSSAFLAFLGSALLYSAPCLLLLLVIELGFAVSSLAAQGIPIYETAMPVKSLAALFCLAIYFGALTKFAFPDIVAWWSGGALEALSR
ncbi:type III secretion protein T [Variovorax boronicumulans]|uniref:EscT/YscT/HrcT family type III secretion system export apparatus protein n=1 Tax=Variovorax boronicumulans TaxID=436515 RepID=UPI00277DB4D8|nr:flagellar biosynthetic protein FliR [Variovorax boronicumulans]MDQ0083806.1 type III secretion protein T [Variovorax boronicumulans]